MTEFDGDSAARRVGVPFSTLRSPHVLRLMLDRGIKHVPVVADDRAIGMIARHDLLKLMLTNLPIGESANAAAGG